MQTNKSPQTTTGIAPRPATRKEVYFVIIAALIGAALKLYCAATTLGTNDVKLNFDFGRDIYRYGLDSMYHSNVLFNHTPVTGSFVCLAYALASKLNPPGSVHQYQYFPLILRFPMIIADFLVVLIMLKIREKIGKPPLWAMILFALSPVSFMVSGFHGNVDPMMVLFLLGASYFCASETHPWASGLLFGLSCNVKIVPLMLAPISFFFWMHRGGKQGLQFFVISVLTCLAGWSAALVGEPALFIKNVLGYSSYWGFWGITYLLNSMHMKAFGTYAFLKLTPAQAITISMLKAVIVLSVLVLAWFGRKAKGCEFFSVIAIAWAIFFVFAPGIAGQYMVWLAPFILIYSPWWYAGFTVASSLFLFMLYNTISHGMPWNYGDARMELVSLWLPWSLLPWGVLVALLIAAGVKYPSAIRGGKKTVEI